MSNPLLTKPRQQCKGLFVFLQEGIKIHVLLRYTFAFQADSLVEHDLIFKLCYSRALNSRGMSNDGI